MAKILTLADVSDSRYFRKKSTIQAIVTGKALTPYFVPKEIVVECKPKRTCGNCPVLKGEKNTLRLKPDDFNFIRFINIADIHFHTLITQTFNIKPRCDFKFDINSTYTVDEVYLTDIINDNTNEYVSRVGYVINGSLDCNIPYALDCYTIPEPKQQKIVHVITDFEQMDTDIDAFKMNPDTHKKLKIFQPEKDKTEILFNELQELYEIYASTVTRIYNRFDLHMAIDLVYHSPLEFEFNNETIKKGWLDVMVIGDTRCGKGFVSESLMKYYGVGDIVSGENLSFAGLVGGLQQINNRWIITWGKIPLNHRRLVIIDEAGEMAGKDFSRLSRIRSEGVAEITKIQTERAPAKTRLIFLSNPPKRQISSYSFGIESLSGLIENSEDISRFDYALVVAQDEVDINEINQERTLRKNPFKKYDPLLIQWVWSRLPEQIQFTKEATELILKQAIRLGQMYSPKIPLIQGENIRIKLARIAAAIAGRFYSTDNKGENLIIKPCHVEAAATFLNILYKKPSSGYYFYSKLQKESSTIHNQPEFEKWLNMFANKNDIIDYFVHNNQITLTDLSEHINAPKEIAREVVSKLLTHRCIQKKFTFYVKNPSFVKWLRENQY